MQKSLTLALANGSRDRKRSSLLGHDFGIDLNPKVQIAISRPPIAQKKLETTLSMRQNQKINLYPRSNQVYLELNSQKFGLCIIGIRTIKVAPIPGSSEISPR